MESEKKEVTGEEQGESCAKLLEKLRDQLRSSNASVRRQAAFNLSWMQEDGLDILKEVLFGSRLTRAKNAAAYGLRKMRGRMKQMALDVFKDGFENGGNSTKETCERALVLMGELKRESRPPRRASNSNIKEIRGRRTPRGQMSLAQRLAEVESPSRR